MERARGASDNRGWGRVGALTPLRIAGVYWLASIVWIVGSDAVVRVFTDRSAGGDLVQTSKGLFFVTVSAVLLFALMRTMLRGKRGAEALLGERDALLRKLSQQIPGVIYQYLQRADGTSCFPYASEGIRDIYEVTPEQVRESAEDVFRVLHPDDIEMIVASINRSIATLEPWGCEYRVRLPRRGLRWLEGRSVPERLPDGGTLWHGYIHDVTERHEADDALRRSEATFRTLVEHAPEAIVIMSVESGKFVEANHNAERLFGLPREALLETSPAALSPPTQPGGRPSRDGVTDQVGRALRGETPVFEWTHRNSAGEDVLCEVRLVRLPSDDGALIRGSITDIRERKAAERRQALMVQELNHRVKNNLSAVLSIAERSFDRVAPEHAEALRDVKNAFAGRIMALAGLHTLLSQQRWDGVRLRALLEQTLTAYSGGGRVRLDGPDTLLPPRVASALCITLHELATNAAKYGGLSRPDGRVSLTWAIEGGADGPFLRMHWREEGVPLAAQPERRGFGRSLVEEALRYEVSGSATLRFEPDGVRCDITAPLHFVEPKPMEPTPRRNA